MDEFIYNEFDEILMNNEVDNSWFENEDNGSEPMKVENLNGLLLNRDLENNWFEEELDRRNLHVGQIRCEIDLDHMLMDCDTVDNWCRSDNDCNADENVEANLFNEVLDGDNGGQINNENDVDEMQMYCGADNDWLDRVNDYEND